MSSRKYNNYTQKMTMYGCTMITTLSDYNANPKQVTFQCGQGHECTMAVTSLNNKFAKLGKDSTITLCSQCEHVKSLAETSQSWEGKQLENGHTILRYRTAHDIDYTCGTCGHEVAHTTLSNVKKSRGECSACVKDQLSDRQLEMQAELTKAVCRILKMPRSRTDSVTYECKCGQVFTKIYRDWIRRGCRSCKTKQRFESETDIEGVEDTIESDGEIWRRIPGGWISNRGRAKTVRHRLCTLDVTEFRYNINGKHQYASRLVAVAFQIPGFENLDTQSYVVSHHDNDPINNRVENLYVRAKREIGKQNGISSHNSARFSEAACMDVEDLPVDVEIAQIPELPKHTFYSTGHVHNGQRFLTGSVSNNKYIQLCLLHEDGSPNTLKLHRLICYAFHPIEGRTCLSDYADLQVNHIDGNTLNNSANNLEWTTQAQNMKHAYETKLNQKKCRRVIQYAMDDRDTPLAEFPSVAEASRRTGEKEHWIRECYMRDKITRGQQYWWRVSDPERNREMSLKYSSR